MTIVYDGEVEHRDSTGAGGVIGPGIMIGACRDTGGGWGDSFIAHKSQVFRVPDRIAGITLVTMLLTSAIILAALGLASRAQRTARQ